MARFLGAVYSKQIEPILEHFFGDHQHGFRAGRSTNSLIHILETFTSAAITSKRALYVVQVDIAKAFDKVHRQALIEFVSEIIHPKAPQAAHYITSMYTEDTVEVTMYKNSTRIPLSSGIRQGDPLSPALFSSLMGHALSPMFKRWTRSGYGFSLTENDHKTTTQAVAYADDLTILAQNAHPANAVVADVQSALALAGLN